MPNMTGVRTSWAAVLKRRLHWTGPSRMCVSNASETAPSSPIRPIASGRFSDGSFRDSANKVPAYSQETHPAGGDSSPCCWAHKIVAHKTSVQLKPAYNRRRYESLGIDCLTSQRTWRQAVARWETSLTEYAGILHSTAVKQQTPLLIHNKLPSSSTTNSTRRQPAEPEEHGREVAELWSKLAHH